MRRTIGGRVPWMAGALTALLACMRACGAGLGDAGAGGGGPRRAPGRGRGGRGEPHRARERPHRAGGARRARVRGRARSRVGRPVLAPARQRGRRVVWRSGGARGGTFGPVPRHREGLHLPARAPARGGRAGAGADPQPRGRGRTTSGGRRRSAHRSAGAPRRRGGAARAARGLRDRGGRRIRSDRVRRCRCRPDRRDLARAALRGARARPRPGWSRATPPRSAGASVPASRRCGLPAPGADGARLAVAVREIAGGVR